MRRAVRDPTAEAVDRLEGQSCAGCPWRQWNPFTHVAWFDQPKWTGREAQRPSTKPVGPLALRLHRCTKHPIFKEPA